MAPDAGDNEKVVATLAVVATAIAQTEMRSENAELICAAVNGRAELVAALANILWALDEAGVECLGKDHARAVLARAGGDA